MAKRAAGLVIFRRVLGEIQFLLLKASYGDFHWSPPKGHVDPGEDDFTTALRETYEETGYESSDLDIHKDICLSLNYIVKGQPKDVVYWLAELKDPQKNPTLSKEHTEFAWLPKDDARKAVKFKDCQQLMESFYTRVICELS